MKGNPIYFMPNKRKLAKSGDAGLLCFNLERNMGQSNEREEVGDTAPSLFYCG